MNNLSDIIPKLIFIIPYRNRAPHLVHFKVYMDYILSDFSKTDYKIYFIHQKDNLPFNRGAMKNIGFLAMKNKYPDHYKNITFVFNDIDNMPCEKNLLNYETNSGTIKHFFGFNWTLGGIVSINGGDFEKLNGYPCYWAWGQEDNDIHTRALQSKIRIDRSQFYKFGDTRIINIKNDANRTLSKEQIFRAGQKNTEGITDIKNLHYNFNKDMINVTHFTSRVNPLKDNYYQFDPTKEPRPIVDPKYTPKDAVNSLNELTKWGLPRQDKIHSQLNRSRGIGMKLF
ncbi:Beta-4-Galactosyltransferase [Chrysochromulina ericina virus CeV-01B]|uniref:Beta-4-Galactosyltransferase n=1 Tax=Chrysochromulina ericina virus CeV-01B TaxID=3070830 RepID=A0A0N9QJ43_9VIRU|nr:Beta-4-Galactosyltransferase [Chrysochromulina ericina virus]ALH23147.1 Beta-4-Galactosyltransferase [Chrysochromulina ericina virus CeV-01B]